VISHCASLRSAVIYFDLIKAGEFVTLSVLEIALNER
jgi:hypothetical protein